MIGAELSLPSEAFRREREADWWRLEHIVDTVEAKSADALSADELLELPRLYRNTLSALSFVRAQSLDASLLAYLETLSQRAYLVIYGARTPLGSWLRDFFVRRWSTAVRSIWLETLLVAIVFTAAAFSAYWLSMQDESWFYAFIDPGMAGERNPAASADSLRATLYNEGADGGGLSIFASFLFTNNARVAITAFALGFALGIPSLLLITQNGAMLGAIASVFAAKGLGSALGGWLFIHGSTEIFAILLSGAAGLSLARAIIFPGNAPRLQAATRAGLNGAVVMVGVVIMMMIAGLLEGFGRETIHDDGLRYGIGALMLVFWLAYFYRPFGSGRMTGGDRA